MKLLGRLRQLRRAFYDAHEVDATRVHFTHDDEHELYELSAGEVGGEIMERIMTKGVRDAFPTFWGLEVVWDADETKIE